MASVPGAERGEQTDVEEGETKGDSWNKSIVSHDSEKNPFASVREVIDIRRIGRSSARNYTENRAKLASHEYPDLS